MSFTLSSSRTQALKAPAYARSVVHHARPARRPQYPSPLTPLAVKPTAGTSRPQPSRKNPPTPPSVQLADSLQGLTFHYAPPPSAPNYSNGVVPDLLRWVQGAQVRASAEARAPLMSRKAAAGAEQSKGLEAVRGLSAEAVAEIRTLREQDPVKWTRKALAERFSIPKNQTEHLARLAPAPKSHRAHLAQQLESTRNGWTWRKRAARDAREIRKEFW